MNTNSYSYHDPSNGFSALSGQLSPYVGVWVRALLYKVIKSGFTPTVDNSKMLLTLCCIDSAIILEQSQRTFYCKTIFYSSVSICYY